MGIHPLIVLNVAEKPTAARLMAQIISRNQKQVVEMVRSHSEKNPLHNFNHTIKN